MKLVTPLKDHPPDRHTPLLHMVPHHIRTARNNLVFHLHTHHCLTCKVMSSLSLETFKKKLTGEGCSGLLVILCLDLSAGDKDMACL